MSREIGRGDLREEGLLHMRARGRSRTGPRAGPGPGRSFQVRGMEGGRWCVACLLLVLLRVLNMMYHFYIWARLGHCTVRADGPESRNFGNGEWGMGNGEFLVLGMGIGMGMRGNWGWLAF